MLAAASSDPFPTDSQGTPSAICGQCCEAIAQGRRRPKARWMGTASGQLPIECDGADGNTLGFGWTAVGSTAD
jgi:hypothetical protein